MKKEKYLLIVILSGINHAAGQFFHDTVLLNTVEVFYLKDKSFDAGKKIESTDSVLKNIFSLAALSDLLNYQTAVFVKNYAPGSIGNISVRGGNAQQTAVLWNGININHPMLGQTDISQYASVLFDDVSVEYGASSSLWGSGAMNGSLRINNSFSDQFSFKYRAASFNTHQVFFRQGGTIRKLRYYFGAHHTQSENNYHIGDSIRLSNADFTLRDGMVGVAYDFSSHHRLKTHWWIHQGITHIPNNYFFNKYSALQKTFALRGVADYVYEASSWKLGVKTAYLNDGLYYKDSIARINSDSRVHTVQSEENVFYNIFNQAQLVLGHQFVFNYAITNNYLNNEYIARHSLYAGLKQAIGSFKYNLIVRKEWANISSFIPFTGNAGAEYRLHQNIHLKAQASSFYRLPTLNDLYWKGSGDISLKPESGYGYEGGIVFKFQIQKRLEYFSEWTAFHRITDNWIIWLPGGSGSPVPANISKVRSRGTETDNHLLLIFKDWKIKVSVASAYILSTIEKSKISNDASVGKQLIYTPRYNVNGGVQLLFQKWFVLYTHQYVGYRFVSSDNLQWLEPYYIGNFAAGYNVHFKKTEIQITGGMNNVFNTSYMIVSQRPMPPRNYFVQINLHIQSLTNKNQQL
ncbi:MAG: TonB-dependent receptor [Bacteroidia bacterium]|nr:MAG: TonB-dependent receptor [Bacteroidia bacterium]